MRFLFIIISTLLLFACKTVTPKYYLSADSHLIDTMFNQRAVNKTLNAPLLSIDPATSKLHYGLYANTDDHRVMNIIPDFSYAGYGSGGVRLPSIEDIPVLITLTPLADDNHQQIQAAIDSLASKKVDKTGLRGAILLKKGVYNINKPLRIKHSGIVLRGEGQDIDGTILRSTNTAMKNTFITAQGKASKRPSYATPAMLTEIDQTTVATGATSVTVVSSEGYKIGDEIAIMRTPNALWTSSEGIDTQQYNWKVKSYALAFERTITAITGNRISFDIPMVDTIEQRFGGGQVYRMDNSTRIHHIGIENLRLQTLKRVNIDDEARSFYAIRYNAIEHSWVRDVTVQYFSHGFNYGKGSRFNTMQDIRFIDANFRIEGGHHYGFNFDAGSLNLFQRCYGDSLRHTFVSGSRATGPNVFLDCLATHSDSDSGPHHRWATGTLYDNLKGSELNVQNRANWGTGHGWAGAQQMFYNNEFKTMIVQAPPFAMNYAVGNKASLHSGKRVFSEADGIIESHELHITPRSLYLQQLQDRLGEQAVLNITTEAQRIGPIWDQLNTDE